MTTKTKPSTSTSYRGRVAKAQTDHVDDVARFAEELAQREKAISDLETSIETAEEHRADVLSALVAEEPDFTNSDLATATAGVEVAQRRLEVRKQRFSALERRPANVQTDAALGLVPFVETMLPGVDHLVTCGQVPDDIATTDLPLVVIRQTSDSDARDGILATRKRGGAWRELDVEIHFFRTITQRELNRETVERVLHTTCTKARFASLTTRQVGEGLYLDIVRLQTHQEPAVPAVIDYRGHHDGAKQLASAFTARAASNYRLRVGGSTVSDVSTTLNAGVRNTVVTGTSDLAPAPARPDAREVHSAPVGTASYGREYEVTMPKEPEQLLGEVFNNLGRVTEVSYDRVSDASVRWTLVLTSRETYDTPHPGTTPV